MALVLAWQQSNISQLRRELRQSPNAAPVAVKTGTLPDPRGKERVVVQVSDPALEQRLASLERAVREWTRVSDLLAERGVVPLSTNRLAELLQKVGDTTLPEGERLQNLRALRRNRGLDEQTVQVALSFFSTATNNGVRENILDQIEGATNAVARSTFLEVASRDSDPEVREQAVDNLRRLMGDPQVEAALWNLAQQETNPNVLEEIDEALRSGPMTRERVELMTTRVLDPAATLDQRLLAVRALQRSSTPNPEVSAAVAQMVQSAQDPLDRARIFGALDGTRDASLAPPLVQGLQDPNPIIRERAADALSELKNDPAVAQWLKHVAANDADPTVRREAMQALEPRR